MSRRRSGRPDDSLIILPQPASLVNPFFKISYLFFAAFLMFVVFGGLLLRGLLRGYGLLPFPGSLRILSREGAFVKGFL